MATIVLAAAGGALGASMGGTVLGLSTAVVGRAMGAAVGRAIDQRIMGGGAETVETGRVDRFRLMCAGEGAPIGQVQGRMRVGGQVIWATRFEEHSKTSGGGKGGPPKPKATEISYSVSLALALCEGEIARVGRVWADGEEIAPESLGMRVYRGTQDQMPDPKIEAVQGHAPAYRGIAYVVLEDLDLTPFGSRVPQLSFEVMRPALGNVDGEAPDLPGSLRGVCLVPGTGEYSLATTPVRFDEGEGHARSANQNSASERTDIDVSLDALTGELPRVGSTALVVSWFGDDLRCGSCSLRPMVEQTEQDGAEMPWNVSGLSRWAADTTPSDNDGRPVYGGTPSDRAVVEGIEAIRARGLEVMFYPFVLMTQMAGNALPDPWRGGAEGQPVLPWRGRITTSLAPGQEGAPDASAAAEAEVAAFFGTAAPGDFAAADGGVGYSGPQEWSYRRFILHYAHLCAQAGGVDAFCIGSEMRALTQIRGEAGFPAVAELVRLAGEVKAILGPDCDVSYAADWSEYFGYRPQDGSGDVIFHLDPLWADPSISFVGIDNYMPIADWREEAGHLDGRGWPSIYDLGYLRSNVEGGEGFDWYYPSEEARAAQRREPIADEAYGEDWIFRYKDLRGWWSHVHHDRIGGVRQTEPTAWRPGLKPIRFTEFGCAALDKGANQPNKFIDPKSSESRLAHHSNGRRDETMQAQYLRAVTSHWADPANNPVSETYGGRMLDMDRAHAWCWDARPWPAFPLTHEVWSDGANYVRGHWLNGRAVSQPLALAVREVCGRSGVSDADVSDLHGTVRGYRMPGVETGRAALQPLMLAHGFDAVERDGVLRFVMRGKGASASISEEVTVEAPEGPVEATRAPLAEIEGRVRIGYVDGEASYDPRISEAASAGEPSESVAGTELDMALTRIEAAGTAERWLAETRVGRDRLAFGLPPSTAGLGAGDLFEIGGRSGLWRIERLTEELARQVEAVRVEPSAYVHSDSVEDPDGIGRHVPPLAVWTRFLDLPLMRGDEAAHAPHVAASAEPWPGTVAVLDAPTLDGGYAERLVLGRSATVGTTLTELGWARPGVWDRGADLLVRTSAPLTSASEAEILAGSNLAAIGSGEPGSWELFQFAEAELVGERTWAVRSRLRGLLGTDADGLVWPAGSSVVLIDGAVQQLDLPPATRGIDRHYKIGPGTRPWDDPSYVTRTHAFDGVGLRPLSPVHLSARPDGGGGLKVRWIRRSRLDADTWAGEVPLGEDREAYRVRVTTADTILREIELAAPHWSYAASALSSDRGAGPLTLEVAQMSDRWGAGPACRLRLG